MTTQATTTQARAHHADALSALERTRQELAALEAAAEPARATLTDLQAQFRATGDAALVPRIADAEAAAQHQDRFIRRAVELVADAERDAAAAARALLEAEHAEALASIDDARITADVEPLVQRLEEANRQKFEVIMECRELANSLAARARAAAELARRLGVAPPRDVPSHLIENRVTRMATDRTRQKLGSKDIATNNAVRLATGG